MKHLYFFCTVIKHPPLGIVLIATVFICILLGVNTDRDIIIFINNNSQYFYVDMDRQSRKIDIANGREFAGVAGIFWVLAIPRLQ